MTDDLVARINTMPGWVKEMGIAILTASPDEVTCEWEVNEKHHQGYGVVHGGVHCGVIETLASVGAAAVAHPRGQRVVGLEGSLDVSELFQEHEAYFTRQKITERSGG